MRDERFRAGSEDVDEVGLAEVLRAWLAEETQTAIFRSLLALAILERSIEGLPSDLLSAIRRPLEDLYELSLEPGETWGAEDV